MKTKILLISILALILNVNAYDLNLYSRNMSSDIINNTENYLECFSAIKSNISVSESNSFFVYTIKINGIWVYTDYDIVNDINFNNSYTVSLYPDEMLNNNDLIFVDLAVFNYSNMDDVFFYDNITKIYCNITTTTTTTTTTAEGTTTTSTNSTTTTVEETTTTGGTTSTLSNNVFISGVQQHFGSLSFGSNSESEYIIETFAFMISFLSLIFLLFVLYVFMHIKY